MSEVRLIHRRLRPAGVRPAGPQRGLVPGYRRRGRSQSLLKASLQISAQSKGEQRPIWGAMDGGAQGINPNVP